MSKELMTIRSHKGEYSVTFCENSVEYLIGNLPDKNYHIIIDRRCLFLKIVVFLGV